MSFPPNPSTGGGGGSFVINDDHFFADDTARDAYFVLHPDELETGTLIYVDPGYQQYNGSSWVDVTTVVTGPQGDPGEVALGETSDTAYRGDRGKTAYDHSQVAHAPSNAQKNSDITKGEIEAKLTGEISTHSHSGTGAHATQHVTGGDDVIANVVAAGASGLMSGSDKTKLDGIASGAEENVQSDWNATEGDALILNKPSVFTPDTHDNSAHSATYIEASDVTYENLNTNGDVGTGEDQVSAGNHTHSYQPADATLTAIAGLTTAANKLPYATGEDTFGVCDFTSLGRSLIGETTESSVRDLIAAASSTTATQSIYVDSAATGDGTGVDWTNAFTTIQAAVNSLPAIINHAVTIYVRKGSTAYAEATLQRVVAAGSITIQGEYYYNSTVASAGSGAGKFNVHASHSGLVQVGDRVLMIKYSGTVGASKPSDAFLDTVASVDGTEVTLTTRTTDEFTTSCQYVIVRTKCGAITVTNTDNITIQGLNVVTSAYQAITITNSQLMLDSVVVDASGRYGIYQINARNLLNHTYVGINHTYTSAAGYPIQLLFNSNQGFYNLFVQSAASTGALVSATKKSGLVLNYAYLKSVTSSTGGYGLLASLQSYIYTANLFLDGNTSSYKLSIGALADGGSYIVPGTFGDNITTQKSPANWAATTDGSYIS